MLRKLSWWVRGGALREIFGVAIVVRLPGGGQRHRISRPVSSDRSWRCANPIDVSRPLVRISGTRNSTIVQCSVYQHQGCVFQTTEITTVAGKKTPPIFFLYTKVGISPVCECVFCGRPRTAKLEKMTGNARVVLQDFLIPWCDNLTFEDVSETFLTWSLH